MPRNDCPSELGIWRLKVAEHHELMLDVTQSVPIAAGIETVFASLLSRLGPNSRLPDDSPMPMTLECWPGGRWFRDLGEDTGHLWGFVQVYKPPRLLEVHGPLFMSFAATCHVQWRLEEEGEETRLSVRHRGLGPIGDDIRAGVTTGWTSQLEWVKADCE